LLQSVVPLLSHTSDDVARSAAEAISIMSVDIEVKKEALSLGCAPPLQQLLLHQNIFWYGLTCNFRLHA
jgi:hypothetical protein